MLQSLGDLVESCLGAILLDTGFNLNRVWEIMLSFLKPIMSFSSLQLSPIRELRELCQAHTWDLQFLPSKKGKTYSIRATVEGNNVRATASSTGLNKKDAIRICAKLIFAELKVKLYALCSSCYTDYTVSNRETDPGGSPRFQPTHVMRDAFYWYRAI